MSVEVKTPTRTQFEHAEFQCGDKKRGPSAVPTSAEGATRLGRPTHYQRQVSENTRHGRKRRHSERGPDPTRDRNLSISGLPKRRFSKNGRNSDRIVLPTKFLLGGNINDPLNLGSLNDEAINRALNESTPHSSPLEVPHHRQHVQVIIPPNIEDPLGLNTCTDSNLLSPRSLGRNKKKRSKHKRRSQAEAKSDFVNASEISGLPEKKDMSLHIEISSDSELPHEPSLLTPGEAASIPRLGTLTPNPSSTVKQNQGSTEKVDFCEKKVLDEIVSPVIPQTTSPKHRRRKRTSSDTRSDTSQQSKLSGDGDKREKTPEKASPHRSKYRRQSSNLQTQQNTSNVMKSKTQRKKREKAFIYGNYNQYYGYRNPDGSSSDNRLKNFKPEWFNGKDILDVGCNAGHVTLEIAKTFSPLKITGIDLDPALIGMAKKNIRHYLSGIVTKKGKYPASLVANYGPIAAPPVKSSHADNDFPNNVFFITANYVLDSDELVDMSREEYDTILALSITKWIHLNWGDDGLKRVFRRMFKQLRPGGKLILEPQLWPSYKKRKKLTDAHLKNFQEIQLKPEQFREYLLREVGFSTSETLEVPFNKAKGFQRPLLVFTKAAATQPCSHVTTPGCSDHSRGTTPRFQMGWSNSATPNTYSSLEHVYTFSPTSPHAQTPPAPTPAEASPGDAQSPVAQTSDIEKVQSELGENMDAEPVEDTDLVAQNEPSTSSPQQFTSEGENLADQLSHLPRPLPYRRSQTAPGRLDSPTIDSDSNSPLTNGYGESPGGENDVSGDLSPAKENAE